MSSPRRITVGSSRIAICNASLMACWYVIERVAVSATIGASLTNQQVVSEPRLIPDVDVSQSLFRLREWRGLRRGPGVIELLRYSPIDGVEFVFAGTASIDNSLAQCDDRIPLLVQLELVGRAIGHLVALKVPVKPIGLGLE